MSSDVAGPGWSLHSSRNGVAVALAGDWIAREGKGADPGAVERILKAVNGPALSITTTELGRWDTALLVFVAALRSAASEQNVVLDETGLPVAAKRLLAMTANTAVEPRAEPLPVPFAAKVGGAVIGLGDEALAVMTMVGDTILRTAALPLGAVRMRGLDFLTCSYEAGASALPVVTVINILVGCILAFVGAVQLRRFGGEIFIAALVGVGMVREMAALMTAIAMSGRTGGAYAAQIASMRGSEEIDALRAIGIPIQDYLILPRVLALTAMMPLLYLYGSAIGILGGFLVSIVMLNISAAAFIQQIREALFLSMLLFGLVKSVAFGLLIAVASCRIGLRAGRSAADVGHAATQAVVISIVGVIALDAIFAVCANTLDI